MEILKRENYREFEEFCRRRKGTAFQQSPRWALVKDGWQSEVAVSRDSDGKIAGGMTVLIRKLGFKSLLYACRGPVCDLKDADVVKDLLDGARLIAKKYRAFEFIMDPAVMAGDRERIKCLTDCGLEFSPAEPFHKTIQPRYSYICDWVEGVNPENVTGRMSQSARRKMKYGEKRGLVCGPEGIESLGDFYDIYLETGKRKRFSVRGKEYFERLMRAFGDNCRLYMCRLDGLALRGALAINYAGATSYVYGASRDSHRNLMPTYFVQRRLMEWAARTGCFVYDMQGVAPTPRDDEELYGVLKFKENFTGSITEYAGEFKITFDPLYRAAADAGTALRKFIRKV